MVALQGKEMQSAANNTGMHIDQCDRNLKQNKQTQKQTDSKKINYLECESGKASDS